MPEADNWLLVTRLKAVLARVTGDVPAGNSEAAWKEAEAAVAAAGASEDAGVALPVMERDARELAALLAGWDARKIPLVEHDQAVLRRAMNAFKKRLKLVRADDAITSSRNPLSRGASSGITGVRPPEQYPQDVWDTLVAQGRLKDAGHGVLETVGEGPS